MCFNKDDVEAKYRGICLKCQKTSPEKWKEVPDNKHGLKKIHAYTQEWKDYQDATSGKHSYEEYDLSIVDGCYAFTHKTTGIMIMYKIFEGKMCTCCD